MNNFAHKTLQNNIAPLMDEQDFITLLSKADKYFPYGDDDIKYEYQRPYSTLLNCALTSRGKTKEKSISLILHCMYSSEFEKAATSAVVSSEKSSAKHTTNVLSKLAYEIH